MKDFIEMYKDWRGDHDDNWEYDMIDDFFAGLDRGTLLNVVAFIRDLTPEETL